MSLAELVGTPKAALYQKNIPSTDYIKAVTAVQKAPKGTLISSTPKPSTSKIDILGALFSLPSQKTVAAVNQGLITGLVNQTKLPLRPIDWLGIAVMTAGAGSVIGGLLAGGEAAAAGVAGAAAGGAAAGGGSALGAGALTTGAILAATLPSTIATVAKVGLGAGILDYLQKNPWVLPVGIAGLVAIMFLKK